MGKRLVFLFVCSGNTCRSVIAEGLFGKAWKESGGAEIPAVVCSAGTETIDGLAASGEALQVLFDEGVDLSQHRSRIITGALIEEADYIFTMTHKQKETLLLRFPPARGKVWLLAEFAGFGLQGDISDPFGRGLRQYRRTAREIGQAVEKITQRVKARLAEEKAFGEN